MKFTETRLRMLEAKSAAMTDYQRKYLVREATDLLDNLNNMFVEYLTADITAMREARFDFEPWLTDVYYEPANAAARECLEVCPKVSDIYGWRVKSWTAAALQCYDCFMLKLIQDDRQETIPLLTDSAKERDIYSHLKELGGHMKQIGLAFENIYKLRNKFTHTKTLSQSGKRLPKTMNNYDYGRMRDQIMGHLADAVRLLVREIDTT